MSDPRIRNALEAHLAALAPVLPTAWQNVEFDAPSDGSPYQEAYVLSGPNRTVGLKQRTAIHAGIFQVNLCYAAGDGAAAAELRGKLTKEHFNPATVLYGVDGLKIRIKGQPVIGDPVGGRPGRFVVPVSIRFESTF